MIREPETWAAIAVILFVIWGAIAIWGAMPGTIEDLYRCADQPADVCIVERSEP